MGPPERSEPSSWERLESLYERASSLPAAEQTRFLDEQCAGDEALRRELADLLACSPGATGFFQRFRNAIDDPPVESSDPLIGAIIGRYRVETRLGAGGMGVVYRAFDFQLQRTVALKLLSIHLSDDEHARKRFLSEARAAAALDHPNICTIHETGETDAGMPYIAMALCSGETLKAKIARGPLPVREAVGVALQMARGLAVAHARGIIHRDVKPANVMIADDGHAKLVDFGLARLADETVTASGKVGGTFAYMAPELLRGHRADTRSDLWSLGVVLYEMLCGLRPFRADSDAALLHTITHERPEPIGNVLPGLPVALQHIVDRMLHEEPNARYDSARDVIAELEPLAGSVVVTQPTVDRSTTQRPVRKRLLRWRGARAMAAVVSAAVVITLAWLGLKGPAPADPAALPPPRVAVLLFHDVTPQRDADHVTRALTGRLTETLAPVPGLDVQSMNALQPYRDPLLSVPAIARAVRADWLIGGLVERRGEQLVVTAELNDSTGRRVDSRRIEHQASDEAGLLEATVESVALMLRARVGDAQRERRWQSGTRSAEALALIRRAAAYRADADSLVKGRQPRAALIDLLRADSGLVRAARADPKWAEPAIERGWVANEVAYFMFGVGAEADSIAQALERGLENVRPALRGRADARALEVLGVLRHAQTLLLPVDADGRIGERRLADAEKDLISATERDSTLARGLNALSMIQLARGDFEHARLTTERAYLADYFLQAPQILNRLFETAFETEHDSQAQRWCALTARRYPDDWFAAYCKLMLMTWSPGERADADSAWRLVARARETVPAAVASTITAQLEILVAGVVARAVPGDSAARVVQRTRARANDARLDPNGLQVLRRAEAGVRVRLGQPDSAIQLLRQYLIESPEERPMLSNGRIFKALFSDPRLRVPATNR